MIMMRFKFVKLAILIAMLLWGALKTCAQENEACARKLLDFIVAGQGDSVYVHLSDDVRAKVSPVMFTEVFAQLEKQFGKYHSKGEWKKNTSAGQLLYYCDVQFERYALRFLIAFEPDGKANTIRFMPIPPTPAVAPTSPNKDYLEESAIEIVSGSYRLPGTLSLPKNLDKAPVVILVHGSGPLDRDETIGLNKPFRDLAWGLSEQGIAVVRYDKRTYVYGTKWIPAGKEGTYDDETVDDALAAIEWVKKNPSLDAKRIYVVGHSLGGMLAPRIAQRTKALRGIVLLSGNARPLEDLILEQVTYISSLTDSSEVAKMQIELIRSQVANVKKLGTDNYDTKVGLPFNLSTAYWQFAKDYKQVKTAARLTLPILILQGERDYQVTMEDFKAWNAGLSHHKNVSFKSYPKLNHLYQEGKGKSTPSEYALAIPVAKYVVEDIVNWIKTGKVNE